MGSQVELDPHEMGNGSKSVPCMEWAPHSIAVPKGKTVKLYNACEFGGETVAVSEPVDCI